MKYESINTKHENIISQQYNLLVYCLYTFFKLIFVKLFEKDDNTSIKYHI